MLQLTLVSAVTDALAAGRGKGRILLPPRRLGAISTPKPALHFPLQLEGTGTSRPNPARGSAGRRAGTAYGQDYKSHNAPDSGGGGGGEGGGGVFRWRRPRRLPPGSARGSAMELAEPGGESPRRGRAHPAYPSPSRQPLSRSQNRPYPPTSRGGGKMGGVMELGWGGRSPGFPSGIWGPSGGWVWRGFLRRRGVGRRRGGAELGAGWQP